MPADMQTGDSRSEGITRSSLFFCRARGPARGASVSAQEGSFAARRPGGPKKRVSAPRSILSRASFAADIRNRNWFLARNNSGKNPINAESSSEKYCGPPTAGDEAEILE